MTKRKSIRLTRKPTPPRQTKKKKAFCGSDSDDESYKEESSAATHDASDFEQQYLSPSKRSTPSKRKTPQTKSEGIVASAPASSAAFTTPIPKTKKRRSSSQKDENGDSSEDSETDQPMPTDRGGYSHTKSSKRKIGLANKGKKPWNKGRRRSEADKAKISAGVRARNRAALLKKIEAMGITEEEWLEQKRQTKLKREQIRRRTVAEKKKAENVLKQREKRKEKLIKEEEIQRKKDKIRARMKREALESSFGVETILPQSESKNLEVEDKEPEETQNVGIVFSREFIWNPHPFDNIDTQNHTDAYQVCPTGGPGGLVCCKQCTSTYSRYLSHTARDMESQTINKVGHEVREILDLLREANIRLQQAVNVSRNNDATRTYLNTTASYLTSSLKRNAVASLNNSNFDTMTSIMDVCGP